MAVGENTVVLGTTAIGEHSYAQSTTACADLVQQLEPVRAVYPWPAAAAFSPRRRPGVAQLACRTYRLRLPGSLWPHQSLQRAAHPWHALLVCLPPEQPALQALSRRERQSE